MSESAYASTQIIKVLREKGFAKDVTPIRDVQILYKDEVKERMQMLDRAYKTADKSTLVFK